MKPPHSAVIKFDTSTVIALLFARPLSLETIAKLKELEQNEGIQVLDIPKDFGKCGFYVRLSDNWDRVEVARECLKILIAEGFAESNIQLNGFTAN